MKFLTVLMICFAVTFFSCKKSDTTVEQPALVTTDIKDGFPADKQKINGYLFVAVQSYNLNNFSLEGYAAFNDPAKNLIATYDHFTSSVLFNSGITGNVSIGNIQFNNFQLNSNSFSSNSINYLLNSSTSSTNYFLPTWITTGNKSFKPINTTVPRGFPVITGAGTNYTLSISNGFTINLAGLVSNYDSLIVSINNNFPALPKKRIASGSSSVTFSSAELSSLNSNTSTYLTFYAYNYSNKTIENKVNVFELGYRQDNQLYIYP